MGVRARRRGRSDERRLPSWGRAARRVRGLAQGEEQSMRFRSDPSQIRGAICPVVTTFAEDFSLDLDALARVIDWQIESGAHGISVLGSTGETAVQTTEEKERVLET